MDKLIQYHDQKGTIDDIINFDRILNNMDSYPYDIFIEILCDELFIEYIDDEFTNVERDQSLGNLSRLFERINDDCKHSRIRKIILNTFSPEITGMFMEYLWTQGNRVKYIMLHNIDIFLSKKYAAITDIQHLLIRHGIYNKLDFDVDIDAYIFNTHCYHRSHIVERFITETKFDDYTEDIQIMKTIIKCNIPRIMRIRDVLDYSDTKLLCYPDDLFKRKGIRINFDESGAQDATTLTDSLILTHRKFRSFSNPRIKMYPNTKSTYKLLIKIFAKFTTKNMTKLILYHL